MNRRHFFQTAASLIGLGAILPSLYSQRSFAERKRGGSAPAAGGAPVLVSPKDPQAKAVNYVHAHADLKDKALQLDRQGLKWADQKCTNCSFYVKRDKDNKVGSLNVGGCQMPFAKDKVIASEGWCSTWAKKS